MEKCYQFFNCPHEHDCIASKIDKPCWELNIDCQLFDEQLRNLIKKRSNSLCVYCTYYKQNKDIYLLKNTHNKK